MSLNLLNSNRLKPWLNPRVNNLTIDGKILMNEVGFKNIVLSNSNFTVDNDWVTVNETNINNNSYNGHKYICNASYNVNFNSTSECLLRLSVIDNNNNSSLYNGSQFIISGVNGEKKNISVVDSSIFISPVITKNFKLVLEAKTNVTGSDRPVISGNCWFSSMLSY